MDYQELLRKRDAYQEGKHLIPELTIASYERAFEIEYTHHSTAIEGNTLTLMETKLVLEDRISVGGKRLRELYEPLNHEKAFHYVKDCIGKGYALDEKIIKDIQKYLRENLPVIPYANSQQVLGIRSNVKGFTPTPAASHFFEKVYFE